MRLVPLPKPEDDSRRTFIGIHKPILPSSQAPLPIEFQWERTSSVHVAIRSLYVNPPTRLQASCKLGAGKPIVNQRRDPERSEPEVNKGSHALSNANRLRRTDVNSRRTVR